MNFNYEDAGRLKLKRIEKDYTMKTLSLRTLIMT